MGESLKIKLDKNDPDSVVTIHHAGVDKDTWDQVRLRAMEHDPKQPGLEDITDASKYAHEPTIVHYDKKTDQYVGVHPESKNAILIKPDDIGEKLTNGEVEVMGHGPSMTRDAEPTLSKEDQPPRAADVARENKRTGGGKYGALKTAMESLSKGATGDAPPLLAKAEVGEPPGTASDYPPLTAGELRIARQHYGKTHGVPDDDVGAAQIPGTSDTLPVALAGVDDQTRAQLAPKGMDAVSKPDAGTPGAVSPGPADGGTAPFTPGEFADPNTRPPLAPNQGDPSIGAAQLFSRKGLSFYTPQMGQPPGPGEYTQDDVSKFAENGGKADPTMNPGPQGVSAAMYPGQNNPNAGALDPSQVQLSPGMQAAVARAQATSNIPMPADALDKDLEARIKSSYDVTSQGYDALGKLQKQRMETEGAAKADAAKAQLQEFQQMQKARETFQVEQDKAMKPINDLREQMKQIAQVDPNRLWNHMDTGNKILAGMSILFGGLGAGTFAALGQKHENEALKIIQDAIHNDVDVQKMNANFKREGMKDQLTASMDVYHVLRQRGLDEFEAKKAETALKYDAAMHMIDAQAAQMQGAEAQQLAQIAKGQLEPLKGKLLMDIAEHRNSFAAKIVEAQINEAKLALKAQSAKDAQLKAPAVMQLDDLRSAIQEIDEAEAMQNKAHSITGKVTRNIPGTDAKAAEERRNLALEKVAPMLNRGTLRADDRPVYEGYFPHAGDLARKAKWAALRAALTTMYHQHQIGLPAAGYRNVVPALGAGDPGEDAKALGGTAEDDE